jgi:hypothetical protein
MIAPYSRVRSTDWRFRRSKRPGIKAFGTDPTDRVVPEENLDAVTPRDGEGEQVIRQGIESKRAADSAG